MKLTLNPDKEHVKKVREAIKANDGYCCCSIIKDDAHKCICQDATENGICHCNLYLIDGDY